MEVLVELICDKCKAREPVTNLPNGVLDIKEYGWQWFFLARPASTDNGDGSVKVVEYMFCPKCQGDL